MKATVCLMLAFMLGGVARAQAAGSDRENLIGAWRLVSLGEVGPDGNLASVAGLTGSLIYTRDGHMSVQILYPASAAGLTNDYVRDGYEASFGSYEVDEAAHTVTHHVQGSVTRSLVGRSLVRAYQLSGARLVIRPVRADEHWQVVWEHE